MDSFSANHYSRRVFQHMMLAGAVSLLATPAADAQDVPDEEAVVELSPTATTQYGRALLVMQDIEGFLQAINFERKAIIGTNFFSVSVGGIDAIKDLEEGRGVDPETLAGLYAGFALPEVAQHLNTETLPGGSIKVLSPDGRLRYKGTVVRMYSPELLRAVFARRAAFKNENERIKRQAVADYVYARKREFGDLERVGQESEITELIKRFARLQSLLVELDGTLRSERNASSILQGETSQHLFGISVGGIDVSEDLRSRNAVDPESLAAIYAQNISTEYAASFVVGAGGAVTYDGVPVKLYSQKRLEWCFKTRERLATQSLTR